MDLWGLAKANEDGSVSRADLGVPPFFVPASPSDGVPSFDITIDEATGVWARVFDPPAATRALRPVILYAHGGGFVLLEPSFVDVHNFASRLALETGCVVISLAYRLAPEHPLPAAYDDLATALRWIASPNAHERLPASSDLSRLFLLGDSAGGNMIHCVLASGEPKLPAGVLKGVVLLQPFYSGEERTKSEIGEWSDKGFLQLWVADLFWKLALPKSGPPATRNHPFCQPPVGAFPPETTVMMVVGGRDILRVRHFMVAEELQRIQITVCLHMFESEEHAFYARDLDGESAKKVMGHISQFIFDACGHHL